MAQQHDINVASVHPSLSDAARTWARIGCLGFGGPAGQIALMHKTLVDEKRWISEERFLHALNYCMLLPGPEAQQLATYIGWLLHGTRGGIIAGTLFVLPGFLVIVALSVLYALFQTSEWLPDLFFGLKAAVLAIVIDAVLRVGRRALRSRFHLVIAALSFLALFVFNVPFPLLILLSAGAGFAAVRHGMGGPSAAGTADPPIEAAMPPLGRTLWRTGVWLLVWQAPVLLLAVLTSPSGVLAEMPGSFSTIFGFFSKMALVTFGGAYAVLTYVAQMAVGHYAWLNPREMLDGLALAETTPGPLVLVLCFVGFLAAFRNPMGLDPLLAGLAGAGLTAWATFIPSFMLIFAGAPYIEWLRSRRSLSGALSAITAAVVGVILNLSVWFGLHVLFADVGRLVLVSTPSGMPLTSIAWPAWSSIDPLACTVSGLACILLFRLKAGILPTLAACALAGWGLRAFL